MNTIFLTSENPRHFLVDSNGDLYEVSEELAKIYAFLRPKQTVTVDHVDKETNTIWFTPALPDEVQAER